MNFLSTVLLALAVLSVSVVYARAAPQVDTPTYVVEQQQEDFEVRQYPELILAQVSKTGRRQQAVRTGFSPLARYIFAKDRPGDKIAMTAPVVQEPEGGGWIISFIMPEGRSLNELPQPEGNIQLVTQPPRRIAAVRFSGRWTDKRFTQATQRLQGWIDAQGLQAIGPPEYAYYNDPFTLPGRRRNEILIEISP